MNTSCLAHFMGITCLRKAAQRWKHMLYCARQAVGCILWLSILLPAPGYRVHIS